MKNALFSVALMLGLSTGPVLANSNTEAAIGGGLGGVLGAVIGNEVGGSSGAIIGAGVGGAAGAVIANRNNRESDRRHDHHRDYRHAHRGDSRRYSDARWGDPRHDRYRRGHDKHWQGKHHGYFCPPGQGKKGRC